MTRLKALITSHTQTPEERLGRKTLHLQDLSDFLSEVFHIDPVPEKQIETNSVRFWMHLYHRLHVKYDSAHRSPHYIEDTDKSLIMAKVISEGTTQQLGRLISETTLWLTATL